LIGIVETGTDFKLDLVEFLFRTLNVAHGAILAEMTVITGLKELLLKFQTNSVVGFGETEMNPYKLKVLRSVEDYFVPNTPTIAFLLRLGLDNVDLRYKSLSTDDKIAKLGSPVELIWKGCADPLRDDCLGKPVLSGLELL